ncbi:ketoacyl-ACP synthase III [Actinomadura kijaniata]|uniref:3-oxoacyl-[acyl-carrier-protein] synthase-3 n=1 Tax=Actinomadura namibiensis TaxID=182080 RepID=A0A7W3QR94_ACTNM|nr:ketoacyl-ACP synthase III [Actinomadura namibiensis]MBA8956397.1 3-oxoacyl-[acyl-carrier-protein] synthase-3 [Actinomadura namibiensis]
MTRLTPTDVGVIGTGSCLPERRVDSREVAATLGVEHRWIVERVGVLERRFAGTGETGTGLAARAAARALDRAGVAPEDVDAIVLATSTPETPIPGVAARVQEAVGARNAFAFDVNAACAGWLVGIETARGFLRADERRRYVLVVGADTYSRILNPGDRRTYPLFGDGAGAVVVARVPAGEGIGRIEIRTDGRLGHYAVGGHGNLLTPDGLAGGAHHLTMLGRDIAALVRTEFPALVEDAVKEEGLTVADVDHLVCHQANPRLVREVAENAGFRPGQVVLTGDVIGNTAAASLPIGLDTAVRDGRIRAGDTVLMITFGAGMTWGRALMRWPSAARP